MAQQQEAVISDQNVAIEQIKNTASIVFPKVSQSQRAWKDVIDGLATWPIWALLAYQDIKLRYRRSILGPFWLTMSMAITVYTMGYLYSAIFKMEMATYFPYLVGGMLSWTLISTCYNELVDGFTASESMIKQMKLPYTLYVHRIVFRNIIIFLHNLLVMVPVYVIFHDTVHITFYTLALIPGLLIIYANTAILGLILAMLGGRYRDISQIVKSLIQVVFFITPVMWKPSALPPEKAFIVNYNPFASLIELIRAPLTGSMPEPGTYAMALGTTLVGMFFCWQMFKKYRARIVYWL